MVALTPQAPAAALGTGLLDYLRRRLGVGELVYAEPPEPRPDGWETHVFRFRLTSRSPLPPPYNGPLVVRAYTTPNALPRIRRESGVERYVDRLGYPVSRLLFVEEDPSLFGGPFMLMECAPGQTLLEVMLHQFASIWWAPAEMAALHARLHQLPTDGLAWPREPFLSRSLAALEAGIQDHRLYGLAPGLDWLEDRQPPPGPASLLHLDFHPGNLMFDHGRCSAVLDWGDADVGDRHADVGATLVLVESAPVDLKTLWHRIGLAVGKVMMESWYLKAYRDLLPLDEDRLTYYTAWAAFRRLCRWGAWLRAGPSVTGSKASSLRHVRRDRVEFLCRSFRKRTGVAIRLV